jgi:hypothetical protein
MSADIIPTILQLSDCFCYSILIAKLSTHILTIKLEADCAGRFRTVAPGRGMNLAPVHVEHAHGGPRPSTPKMDGGYAFRALVSRTRPDV